MRTHPKPTVQTLAQVLAMTGCRVSEALALRACDVDLKANEVRIATLKRRKEHWRAVPAPEDLVQTLDLVHRVRAAQGSQKARERTVCTITRQQAHRQVAEFMKRAGITGPDACPRGLHHSFSAAAVQTGILLTTIAAVRVHAEVLTTATYTIAIGAEARELVARVWA